MPYPSTHNHIRYNDVRVPLDHLLGPEDGAKVLAQRRLGGGRIHHAMRTIAQCKRAFDMMCERALSRESHGKVIAEHQMVQEAIANSYAEINMLRLLVLWTAWTIDNSSTQAARTQIAACKYTCAKVLREVSYRALHIYGSLGTTNLTPLQAMYAGAPTMGIADGVDEVHKVTVARNVLKDYRPHEGLWPTEYLPAKREQARKKYADLLASDTELASYAEAAERVLDALRTGRPDPVGPRPYRSMVAWMRRSWNRRTIAAASSFGRTATTALPVLWIRSVSISARASEWFRISTRALITWAKVLTSSFQTTTAQRSSLSTSWSTSSSVMTTSRVWVMGRLPARSEPAFHPIPRPIGGRGVAPSPGRRRVDR